MKQIFPWELAKQGGKWLGEAREWIQSNAINGDSVTWGSDTILGMDCTARKMEDFAAHVAAAAINEERERDEREKAEFEQRLKDRRISAEEAAALIRKQRKRWEVW